MGEDARALPVGFVMVAGLKGDSVLYPCFDNGGKADRVRMERVRMGWDRFYLVKNRYL